MLYISYVFDDKDIIAILDGIFLNNVQKNDTVLA
jgi:hypothetical protein